MIRDRDTHFNFEFVNDNIESAVIGGLRALHNTVIKIESQPVTHSFDILSRVDTELTHVFEEWSWQSLLRQNRLRWGGWGRDNHGSGLSHTL